MCVLFLVWPYSYRRRRRFHCKYTGGLSHSRSEHCPMMQWAQTLELRQQNKNNLLLYLVFFLCYSVFTPTWARHSNTVVESTMVPKYTTAVQSSKYREVQIQGHQVPNLYIENGWRWWGWGLLVAMVQVSVEDPDVVLWAAALVHAVAVEVAVGGVLLRSAAGWSFPEAGGGLGLVVIADAADAGRPRLLPPAVRDGKLRLDPGAGAAAAALTGQLDRAAARPAGTDSLLGQMDRYHHTGNRTWGFVKVPAKLYRGSISWLYSEGVSFWWFVHLWTHCDMQQLRFH